VPLIYVSKNGENLGGFDLNGINQGLESGYFLKDDWAWMEGFTQWAPLSEVLGSAKAKSDSPGIQPTTSEIEASSANPADAPINYELKSPRKKYSVSKDAHGQPRALFKANIENNVSKAIDQLSGICTGILADGIVTDQEAAFFREWLHKHAELEPVWPFTDILERVEKVFAHGKIEEEERSELADIMRAICGGEETISDAVNTYSSQLPLDAPPPAIIFPDNEFVITGRFAYGTRSKVNECILTRNGHVKDGFPTSTTRYLVIGSFASRDWHNTNYGRKIERAVELRQNSHPIAVVSEEHWKNFL
jgi:hypothetical protein